MEYIEQGNVGQFTKTESQTEANQAIYIARGLFLDELPGAAFAAITLFWVISSLAGLIWREMPADTIAHLHYLVQAVLGSHALSLTSRLAGAASFAKTVHGILDPRNPA